MISGFTLRTEQIEVWERVPLSKEGALDLPRRIEVVSSTGEIWNEEYDRDEEDTGNFHPKPGS